MDWILQEVQTGFKRLYPLRLKNAPPPAQIQATSEEWALSIARQLGSGIAAVDTVRIREGFDSLVDHSEWWPSPAMLYKAMPSRPVREALPVPSINQEGMEKGRNFLKNIMEKIG